MFVFVLQVLHEEKTEAALSNREAEQESVLLEFIGFFKKWQ